MNEQRRNRINLYANDILNILATFNGKIDGMDEIAAAIQPFAMGDFTKPRTRLTLACNGLNKIMDQVKSQKFDTSAYTMCSNIRAYLSAISSNI